MAKPIALYLPSLRGGGAERVMMTLANGFAARGLSVDLVLAKAEGPYLKEVSETVRIVDLGSSRVLASLPGLIRYLRREQPKAMLSALSHANIVAVWAKQLARVPTRLVVSERNTLSTSTRGTQMRKARMIPWLMRRAYPKADGVIAVSDGVADDLAITIGLPRQNVITVYNPVVTEALVRQSHESVDHPWFELGELPVIIAVGRLTAQKDFSTLIQAFARLRIQRRARLVILGEGELRAGLETLVAKLGLTADVALPGFMDNPFAWMRRSALFVLSSAWEGLPGTLIQAMACAVPVISTDCPSGPAEILEDGKWGRLVPVGNVDAMATAMAATLDDSRHPDVARRAMDFGMDQALEGYLAALEYKPC